MSSLIDICIRRSRDRSILELYEHEVGRLAGELAGSMWDLGKHRTCTAGEIESELRSGAARFYSVPVRCI